RPREINQNQAKIDEIGRVHFLATKHKLRIDRLCQDEIEIASPNHHARIIEILVECDHVHRIDREQDSHKNAHGMNVPSRNIRRVIKQHFKDAQLCAVPNHVGKNLYHHVEAIFGVGHEADFQKLEPQIEIFKHQAPVPVYSRKPRRQITTLNIPAITNPPVTL